jgi:hypothetical protein
MHKSLAVALVLSGCGSCGEGTKVVCASQDLECLYTHLSVREVNGMNAKFLEVDTGSLDAGVKTLSPTPIAPFYAWAVGGDIYGFDGQQWFRELTLPAGQKLVSIWGASSSDIWAVGTANDQPCIYHRDGAGWTAVDAGFPLSGAGFNDVWGSGPNDVWAVGNSRDGGIVAHWNGTTLNSASGMDPNYVAVAGSAANDVWLITSGEVRHFDGQAFSNSRAAPFATAHEWAWATSATDAWVIQAGSGPSTAVHWNGSAWSEVSSGTSALSSNGFRPGGAWGTAQDLWVSGTTALGVGKLSHWNGAAWTDAAGSFGRSMYGVFGTGPSDVWAASDLATAPISHWDGHSWQRSITPQQNSPADRVVVVYDFWAAAPTPAGSGGEAAPAFTNQPAPITFTSADDATTIDLQWTDPNGCRPAVCFSVCRVASLNCFARSLCTEPIRDGLFSGGSHYLVSIAAQPAADDAFSLRLTPLSSADWNPFDGSAGVGPAVDIGVTLKAPVDAGSGAGGGGGSGTGGGGGSGVCPGGFVGSTRLNIPDGRGGCSGTTGAADQCLTSSDFAAAGIAYPGACAPAGTTACFLNGTVARPCCGTMRCVVGSACGGDATVGGKCMN